MTQWKRGDSFFLNVQNSHLYFLIHTPHDGQVVVVNFTTLRERIDPPFVVEPSEHPFLRAQSTIAISRALIWPIQKLELAEQSGLLKRDIPVTTNITSKALESVKNSSLVEHEVRNFLSNVGPP